MIGLKSAAVAARLAGPRRRRSAPGGAWKPALQAAWRAALLALLSSGAPLQAATAAATPPTAPAVALPVLPAQAASVTAFLHRGWHIEQQFQADFDRDGRTDALLLLQPIQPPQPEGPPQGWSAPRRLLLLLRTADGWRLAEHNDRLLPRVDLSSQQDPMAEGEITLQPGGFRLSLGLAATIGSYQMATLRYSFAHDGQCLRLVRYERLELHRATLDTRDLAIDYLKGVVLRSQGNAQSGASQQRRERLPAKPRLCLRDLDDAARFKPM